MNHTDNKKQQQASNDDDKAIDKLEEMWDRQILKGDEEFYESRIQSKAGKENSDFKSKDEPVNQRRRTRRKI